MQANVITQPVANTTQQFPGLFRCTLLKDGVQIGQQSRSTAGTFSFTVQGPGVGSYVATAERLDTSGAPMSDTVASEPLVVSAPELFDAPITVTLTL